MPNLNTGTELGQVAPDFTLPDLEGNAVRFSDYRGHKTVLFIWAPW